MSLKLRAEGSYPDHQICRCYRLQYALFLTMVSSIVQQAYHLLYQVPYRNFIPSK